MNKRLGEKVACKETQNAIKELCEAFTVLAKRKAPCLPQDVLLAFRAADRKRLSSMIKHDLVAKTKSVSAPVLLCSL